MSADVGSVGQWFIALVLKTALSAGVFFLCSTIVLGRADIWISNFGKHRALLGVGFPGCGCWWYAI